MTEPRNIVTAPARNSLHWTAGTVTWAEILEWVKTPASVKECGNYILGKLRPTTEDHGKKKGCTALHRTKYAIESRSYVTLDADTPSPDFVADMIGGSLALIHTTFQSTPAEPRYRVIMPTDRDMLPDEYHAVCSSLIDSYGAEQFDPGSVQPERYMFRPSASRPEWFQSWVVGDGVLCVDDVLASWDPDLSKLPQPKPSNGKRDPFSIEGPVGAFNRAYSIDEVIEAYALPYTPVGDRWQLVGTKAEAGMGIIAPGLVFSHHTTDPAAGQTCSAFDLVRLHRYGHLDEDTPASTPVNRRPSHLAMLDTATIDPRVVALLVGADFDAELDEIGAEGTDWRLRLALTRAGVFADTIANWDLVRAHDPVFAALFYNEMTMSVEIDRDLPWRPLARGGATFNGTDRAALYHYLEREFKIRPARSFVDELVVTTAQQRYVNPIKDYLMGLEWDGKPRLDECLPGVRPTAYTRMVARKSLVAAVARIMTPGCKWDHALVLFGLEGLGKSYWVEKMARGYSATLGRIGDKDTLLTMQRSWIMVSDEGYSLRKADSDVQKEFLTRTEDVFRMPYDREAQLHKRHCVIWGTTNDEVFLRRQEGNRRFLIVRCEDPVDFEALTPEYVDQVWAEAVHAWRKGERLFLADTESAAAASEREEFTEEDALAGVLYAWLDTKVPREWDTMSPEARVMWMQNRADALVPEGTEPITEICSAQVWVEVLGRRFGDHRRADLLDINATLKRLAGWEAVPGRHRVHHYGPQLVFRRTDGEDLI
jgi:hypothetical protein